MDGVCSAFLSLFWGRLVGSAARSAVASFHYAHLRACQGLALYIQRPDYKLIDHRIERSNAAVSEPPASTKPLARRTLRVSLVRTLSSNKSCRRKRQRLPTCLLIENASGPTRLPGNFCAEAFPIKASDNQLISKMRDCQDLTFFRGLVALTSSFQT